MRVGILTSGGDCQALNATMRGLALTLYRNVKDVEIIGFIDGYKGLMYEKYKKMKPKDFYDILNVGGNGSIKSANMLSQEGLNVVALPKTIDNDAWGTDYTFGYSSATAIATRYLDEIKTTAASHSRVFVIEVMGHKVGHICLSAGIAAGADVILLPEIPYDIKVVAKKVKETLKNEKNYAIIACAEGAISEADALMKKKDYKAKVLARNGRSVVYEVADELSPEIDAEIRVSCIGHAQRGGNPDSYDREISTRFGVEGARLIIKKHYGEYVVLQGNHVTHIPLEATAGKLKFVDTEGEIVQSAKLVGISFGE